MLNRDQPISSVGDSPHMPRCYVARCADNGEILHGERLFLITESPAWG